jgi:hypothetical protein
MRKVLFLLFLLISSFAVKGYSQYNDVGDFIVIDYSFGGRAPDKVCFDDTKKYLESIGSASDSSGVKKFLRENIHKIIVNGDKGLFELLFSNENYYEESLSFLKWIGADVNKPFYFLKSVLNFADTYYLSGDNSFDYYGWGSLTPMYPLDYLYFKKYRCFPYIDTKSVFSYNLEVSNYINFTKEFKAIHSASFDQMKSNLISSYKKEIERTDFRNRTMENDINGSYKETIIRSMKKGNNIICALRQSSYLNLFPDDRTDDVVITYYTNSLINKKATRKKTTRDNFKTTTSDFIEVEYDNNLLPKQIASTKNYYDSQNNFNDNFFGFDCWGYNLNYEEGLLNGTSYIYGYINNQNVYFSVEYIENERVEGSEVFYNADGTKNDQLNYVAKARSTFMKATEALTRPGAGKRSAAILFKEAFAVADKITNEFLPLYNARGIYKDKKSAGVYPSLLPPRGFMEDCLKKGYISGW